MKLRYRPISAILVEAALTGFMGNISVAGSTQKEPIAVDIYVEEGAITHCTGYLGDREVSDEECSEVVMSIECVNCGAELTRLPPDRIVRKYRRPILLRELVVSEGIDDTSRVLKENVSAAEIVLKGRMILFVKAGINKGLSALAELSTANTAAMVAASERYRLVVISSNGRATAAYLRLGNEEFLGREALSRAWQGLGDNALIQIFSLPDEMARVFSEGASTEAE